MSSFHFPEHLIPYFDPNLSLFHFFHSPPQQTCLSLLHTSIRYVLGTMETRSPLLMLPNEVFQSIAFLLPTDKDVTNLASTCREARQRLLADDSWTWRGLFEAKYDLLPGKTSTEVMYEYLARAIVLPQQINFKPGGREKDKRKKQDLWLQIIQTMLIEALDMSLKGQVSKTYDSIERAMANVGFLNQPKSRTTSELFYAIQIVSEQGTTEGPSLC